MKIHFLGTCAGTEPMPGRKHASVNNGGGSFRNVFPVEANPVKEGVLFDDGFMKVTAFGNTHLSYAEVDHCLSYSYLIE